MGNSATASHQNLMFSWIGVVQNSKNQMAPDRLTNTDLHEICKLIRCAPIALLMQIFIRFAYLSLRWRYESGAEFAIHWHAVQRNSEAGARLEPSGD